MTAGKKLKRRLEDLERRAGSASASPPQTHAEIQPTNQVNKDGQQFKSSPEIRQQLSPSSLPSQYTPPMQSDDDVIFTHGFERDGSRTPPLFAYHTYPVPGDVIYSPYGHSQPYRQVSSSGDWSRTDTDYLAPVPVTLPSMMQFHDSIKREHEDTMSPFHMSYQAFPSLDIHGQQAYDDPNPHVCQTKAM